MITLSNSKTLLVIMCIFLGIVFSAYPAHTQTHIWSQRFGDWDRELGHSVHIDSFGNCLMTGYFNSTIDLGGGTFTSNGYYDIFIAKYDANGNHLWSKQFGDWQSEIARSVTTDEYGNVYLTGSFYGSINFGGSTLTSEDSEDIFLVKFDPSGNHLWSKCFPGQGDDDAYSVVVDKSGIVFITGSFWETVNFGGSTLTSAGYTDIFLASFDTNGNHLWSKRFGGSNHQEGRSLSIDGAGDIVITGTFWNTVNFGGGTLTSAGNADIFLAKFDASGNHLWSKRLGGTDYDEGYTVSFDGPGNVIVSGRFSGTVNFGGGALSSSANTYDIFLAKYDGSTGSHIWSKRFGGVWDDLCQSLRTDGCGNIIITGYFGATVNFGGVPLTSAGDEDIFLAKYDSDGNHLWSQRFGGTTSDSGFSVALDATGDVLLTGYFHGTVNFGGGPLTSQGYYDIFLAKYQGSLQCLEDVSAWILRDSSLIPTEGNILLGCPQGDLDHLVIQVDLADAYFSGTIAKERFSMSMPLIGNVKLYAIDPSDLIADQDASSSNGYFTTLTRPWIGGCGQDVILIYLDGTAIGRVNIEVKSPDMLTSGSSALIVDLSDLSKFGIHYPSCQSGPGNYSPCADFYYNGCVDLSDFALFSMHYLHKVPWW